MSTNHRVMRIVLPLVFFGLAMFPPGVLRADDVYDCRAPENREKATTVEFVLAKKWKNQVAEIKQTFDAEDPSVKVRIRFFPFLDPPTNIGIGKCVDAEIARTAIQASIKYSGGVDRVIVQEILPHHWIKIGSTDTAEIGWLPISADDLEQLTDPALSTEQFQAVYQELATMKEKPLPFGMGSIKREKTP